MSLGGSVRMSNRRTSFDTHFHRWMLLSAGLLKSMSSEKKLWFWPSAPSHSGLTHIATVPWALSRLSAAGKLSTDLPSATYA